MRLLPLILLLTASAPLTFGAAIISQPPVWTTNGSAIGAAFTSQLGLFGGTQQGFRTFDDFTLGSTAFINQAVWFGLYVNNADLTNAAPNTTTWTLDFLSDNGAGAPGAGLQTTSIAAASVLQEAIGSGAFNGNSVTVYRFTANLPGITLGPGKYWFSPLSQATFFDPLFAWIQGTNGNNASYQAGVGTTTGTFNRTDDRAFALSGVPEPSSILLLGAGLAAGFVVRMRKRN